jgi:hypothetical protein
LEEDDYSFWAYGVSLKKSGSTEIQFDGFLASKGDFVSSQKDVKVYIGLGSAPPLHSEFKTEASILKYIRNEDVQIRWRDNNALLKVGDDLRMILDFDKKVAYTKAVNQICPYGQPFTNWG